MNDEYQASVRGLINTTPDRLDEWIKEMQQTPTEGVNWNDSTLNRIYGGFTKKSLTVFSAPSGAGKTTFLIQEAVNLALNHGCKVLYVSIEQEASDLVKFFVSCATGVFRNKIWNDKYLTDDDKNRILGLKRNNCIGNLYAMRVTFNNNTIQEVANYVLLSKIEYVFFDYISIEAGLDLGPYRDDLVLKFIADQLKELAIQTDCAVVTATQVNNNNKRKDVPWIRDAGFVRGSYGLIDKADVAMIATNTANFSDLENSFLSQFKENPSLDINDANLIIDVYKNRRGKAGMKLFRQEMFENFRYKDILVVDTDKKVVSDYNKKYDVFSLEDDEIS